LLNKIIDAISLKLQQEFGSGITIYKEQIGQGEVTPCFFILLQSSNRKKMIGTRYFKEQKFAINYHPATTNKNAEILDIIERLNKALEYISVDNDLFRGTKMSCEIVNSILNFSVNYNFFIYEEAETTNTMESVLVDTGI